MRTTLTIDDQLLAALKDKAFREGKSFKAVVNEALAAGLAEQPAPRRRKPFRVRVRAMGEPALDLTKAVQLAGDLEDAALLGKLELRK